MTEGVVEDAVLEYFRTLGYHTLPGPLLAPDGEAPERGAYDEVVLVDRLRTVAAKLNPNVGPAVVDQAIRQLLRPESQNPLVENERFHRLLTTGIPVEHRTRDGSV